MKLRRHQHNRPLVLALWANAALLGGILVALASRNHIPEFFSMANAQNQPAIGGGAGVFIVPAQFTDKAYGCYLMDIDSQTLCAYQYLPPDHKLKFVASRNFRYDRQLGEYNTEPSPKAMKALVDEARQTDRVLQAAPEKPPAEAPKPE